MTWEIIENKLTKEFSFESFIGAIDFIKKLAPIAEELNHHPDLFLHDYNKLTISLTTHTAGKVTEKDYELATRIDDIK